MQQKFLLMYFEVFLIAVCIWRKLPIVRYPLNLDLGCSCYVVFAVPVNQKAGVWDPAVSRWSEWAPVPCLDPAVMTSSTTRGWLLYLFKFGFSVPWGLPDRNCSCQLEYQRCSVSWDLNKSNPNWTHVCPRVAQDLLSPETTCQMMSPLSGDVLASAPKTLAQPFLTSF